MKDGDILIVYAPSLGKTDINKLKLIKVYSGEEGGEGTIKVYQKNY